MIDALIEGERAITTSRQLETLVLLSFSNPQKESPSPSDLGVGTSPLPGEGIKGDIWKN